MISDLMSAVCLYLFGSCSVTGSIKVRKGDSPFHEPKHQSNRFVQLHDKWYFLTREKGLQGPFVNELTAKIGLAVYMDDLNGVNAKTADSAKNVIAF